MDVAVDTISRLVYYADFIDRVIGVIDMNLYKDCILIRNGLVKPYTIAVDPIGG